MDHSVPRQSESAVGVSGNTTAIQGKGPRWPYSCGTTQAELHRCPGDQARIDQRYKHPDLFWRRLSLRVYIGSRLSVTLTEPAQAFLFPHFVQPRRLLGAQKRG